MKIELISVEILTQYRKNGKIHKVDFSVKSKKIRVGEGNSNVGSIWNQVAQKTGCAVPLPFVMCRYVYPGVCGQ